jgi:hypothetical protein
VCICCNCLMDVHFFKRNNSVSLRGCCCFSCFECEYVFEKMRWQVMMFEGAFLSIVWGSREGFWFGLALLCYVML